jgi:hypothetical protein
MALIVVLLAVAACTDRPLPTDPNAVRESPRRLAQAVACRADVLVGSIDCQDPIRDPASSLSLAITLGGQGTFVLLASQNVSYDGTSTFQAEVTVQNLIAQALATTDGTTLDPDGVRVFFHSGPRVTEGSGVVSVANADGTGTFTGSSQPYFQYDEILAPDAVSATKTWQWSVPPNVVTFAFEVYVTAAVQHSEGWVTAMPDAIYLRIGETEPLSATAWDAVGREQEGAGTTYLSTDPGIATVSSGVVTAVANGTAAIVVTNPPFTPDTVPVIVIQPTTPELGFFHALTDFGGLVVRTGVSSADELGVYQKTYLFRDWTCGTGTWDTVQSTSGAVADYEDGEFFLGLPYGDMIVYEPPNGPHLEVELGRGLFDASDHVVGNWRIASNGTLCSGSWEGELATGLYLDYDSDAELNYLTTERPPVSGSAWIANFGPGDVFEWKTELGSTVQTDVYSFSMVLAIAEEGSPDGVFDIALIVDDGIEEEELASTTFTVPYHDYFRRFEDIVRGQTGGTAGDTIIVRVTFVGPTEAGAGGLAFDNPSAADSHVLLDRNVPIVETAAPARVVAAGGSDTRLTRVDVQPGSRLRWPERR